MKALRGVLTIALAGMLLTGMVACGDDDSANGSDGSTPAEGETPQGGGDTSDGQGGVDVSEMEQLDMTASNFSFDPANLRGTPGQELTILVDNSSGTGHNFSLDAQDLDQDVADGEQLEGDLPAASSRSTAQQGQGMEAAGGRLPGGHWQ